MKRFFFLLVLLLVLAAAGGGVALFFLSQGPYDAPISEKDRTWGITFSTVYARQLGLTPEDAFTTLLDGLGVKRVRLPVYWEDVEPTEEDIGYDFSQYDSLLLQAQRRNVKVVLVLGRRVPRWPECHMPEFVHAVTENEQRELTINLLRAEAEHFKSMGAVVAWQVENEPFVFFFGKCPKVSESFFSREVALVRERDPSRPIIVTDSGELSLWLKATQYADIFGTTVYRYVPSAQAGQYTKWFLPPWFYSRKANLARRVHPTVKDVIISELQAEPWAQGQAIQNLSFDEQFKSFNKDRFLDTLHFAQDTHFKEIYLWGAEWWLWAKQKGHPEFWDSAKNVFAGKL